MVGINVNIVYFFGMNMRAVKVRNNARSLNNILLLYIVLPFTKYGSLITYAGKFPSSHFPAGSPGQFSHNPEQCARISSFLFLVDAVEYQIKLVP